MDTTADPSGFCGGQPIQPTAAGIWDRDSGQDGNRRRCFIPTMQPFPRLIAAAASNGLLTGQIVFSLALIGACELPNWIQAPRQVNACRSRSKALALFFPSGMQTAIGKNLPALAPDRRGVFR